MWIHRVQAAALLALTALAGCENRLPTVTGETAFPRGQVPTTVDLVLPAAQFLTTSTVYEGFESERDASYLLLANRFENALTSHALVRFAGFPDSVTYTTGGTARTEANFTYGAARVVAVVDSAASTPRTATTLQLLTLIQPWDTAAVSWQNAVERPGSRVAWRTPGGTTGDLVAEASWAPGDTARKDTIAWTVDSLTVRRLARGEVAGLLVRTALAGSRVEISNLTLEARIRPAGKPDTVLTQRITAGSQTFIYTPDLPQGAGTLRTGGVTGARTVLRLNLAQTVPTCPPPATAAGCRQVPLREVTLNQAVLFLDPLPVPSGFRPVAPVALTVRRLLEADLGRSAPLGEILAQESIGGASFSGGTQTPASIDLTGPVREVVGTTSPMIDLVLLSNLGAANFGSAWFASSPRLRLIYTVPAALRLP